MDDQPPTYGVAASSAASIGMVGGAALALLFSVGSSLLSLANDPAPEVDLLVVFVIFATICGAMIGLVSALCGAAAVNITRTDDRRRVLASLVIGTGLGATIAWLPI